MAPRLSLVIAATMLIVASPGCGSSTKACGPIVHDPLDPGSGSHVLSGAPPPSYIVDPPTSGAHQPGPTIRGPQHEPIAPQLQVGVLEEGRVLIQYTDLSDTEVKRLETLNSADVLVAPAASLPDHTKVAATAWVTHQRCTAVDLDTLGAFAEAFVGKGPAGH